MTISEKTHLIALQTVPGIGPQLVKQLIAHLGSAEEVFKKTKAKLKRVPGIGEATSDAILTQSDLARAAEELQKTEAFGANLISYKEDAYSTRLKNIFDAPVLLYAKGNLNMNAERMVAIVGARQATAYGKTIVSRIIEELAPARPVIVSGLAYGIDIVAHQEALRCGLPTIAVMANGIDKIYPHAHRHIAERMQEQGGLLTELPLSTAPDAFYFPPRNRIIAGLCDAVVVVEAAEKGGSLITAKLANDYDREVFAVPGNIGQPYSEGCNQLIKTNQAHLLASGQDLLYMMQWDKERIAPPPKQLATPPSDLTAPEIIIWQLLKEKKEGMHIDEIIVRSALSPGETASALLLLEIKKQIKTLPGKIFLLV